MPNYKTVKKQNAKAKMLTDELSNYEMAKNQPCAISQMNFEKNVKKY